MKIYLARAMPFGTDDDKRKVAFVKEKYPGSEVVDVAVLNNQLPEDLKTPVKADGNVDWEHYAIWHLMKQLDWFSHLIDDCGMVVVFAEDQRCGVLWEVGYAVMSGIPVKVLTLP